MTRRQFILGLFGISVAGCAAKRELIPVEFIDDPPAQIECVEIVTRGMIDAATSGTAVIPIEYVFKIEGAPR